MVVFLLGTDEAKRTVALVCVATTALDVLSLPLALATLATGWRTRCLVRDVRSALDELHAAGGTVPWARAAQMWAPHRAVVKQVSRRPRARFLPPPPPPNVGLSKVTHRGGSRDVLRAPCSVLRTPCTPPPVFAAAP